MPLRILPPPPTGPTTYASRSYLPGHGPDVLEAHEAYCELANSDPEQARLHCPGCMERGTLEAEVRLDGAVRARTGALGLQGLREHVPAEYEAIEVLRLHCIACSKRVDACAFHAPSAFIEHCAIICRILEDVP